MKLAVWLAAVVLFLHLPIPLYWFLVHSLSTFWQGHHKAAYVTSLLRSCPPVTAALVFYRQELFRNSWPPVPMLAAGLVLIIF